MRDQRGCAVGEGLDSERWMSEGRGCAVGEGGERVCSR